jgi:hypothetical protein
MRSKVAALIILALLLGGPSAVLAQAVGQPGQKETLVQPEPQRPGVADQTGRAGLTAPRPEATGRAGSPACRPLDERTGRGAGAVCRPAEELPRRIAPQPEKKPQELGPLRPTGPQIGDYPGAFRRGAPGGVPNPYGPGQDGTRGGY